MSITTNEAPYLVFAQTSDTMQTSVGEGLALLTNSRGNFLCAIVIYHLKKTVKTVLASLMQRATSNLMSSSSEAMLPR